MLMPSCICVSEGFERCRSTRRGNVRLRGIAEITDTVQTRLATITSFLGIDSLAKVEKCLIVDREFCSGCTGYVRLDTHG